MEKKSSGNSLKRKPYINQQDGLKFLDVPCQMELFQSSIEAISDAVHIVDKDLKIVYHSQAFKDMLKKM